MNRIPPRPGPRTARGFSLIEMVAAFLVFAIGIGVLMQILGASLHNTRRSADYTQAALWAESLLDTVGVGQPVEEGSSNGRFDDDYAWQLDIQKIDPQAVEPPPQVANPLAAGNGAAAGQPAGESPLTSSAGNSGAIEVSPVDLFRVDLTVLWGSTERRRQAHFTTLRAANPQDDDANRMAPMQRMQSQLSSSRNGAGQR
jgi:general secretion pathway protein I